jgi:hypothetical protein
MVSSLHISLLKFCTQFLPFQSVLHANPILYLKLYCRENLKTLVRKSVAIKHLPIPDHSEWETYQKYLPVRILVNVKLKHVLINVLRGYTEVNILTEPQVI